MILMSKKNLRHAALAASVALLGGSVLADSLSTTDGDMLVGKVTKTASGYTVQTVDGPVDVPANKVKHVLYDHPPAGANAAPTATVDAGASALAKEAVDPRMITKLLEQGQAAMTAAQYGDARDAFKDALEADPNNGLAGRGLGFAYLAMGKFAKAVDPLEVAARASQLDRTLTLAISSSLVASHNSMRAVKYLMPYLQAHSSPVDEMMLNAMGISLSQADSLQTKSTLFQDATKLYTKQNADLEATRPGKKRWGTEWLGASEVTDKQAARSAAQAKNDDAWTKLLTGNAQLQSAQNELTTANNNGNARKADRDRAINAAQKKVNAANDAQTKAQAEYDKAKAALADTPAPTFPTTIVVEDSDLLIVLPGAGAAPATDSKPPADNGVASAVPVAPLPDVPARKEPGESPKTSTPDVPKQPQPEAAKHLTRYAAAFFIAPDILVTSSTAVEDASDLTVTTADGKTMKATILQSHHKDGLSLLKVQDASYPCLTLASEPGSGAVSCLGFPEVDLFNPIAHSLDVTAGEQGDSWTVRFEQPPRVPGGPLMQDGKVVGVELGERDSDLTAVPAATLKTLLNLAQDSAHPQIPAADPKQAMAQVMAER